jgi:DNA (cytosine-5)-methyltransferase 1
LKLPCSRSGPPKSSQAYIKVSEGEIADDYPPPIPYNKEEEETDELLLAEEDMLDVDPEYLPRRVLTDFSIYNAEGLLATLELLPMASGVDADIELYASGVVVDDDGDFSGAQKLDGATADVGEAGGSSGSAGGSSSAAGGAAAPTEPAGMRMYLSQIREWVVEIGADMLFITLRTDVAWYRLAQPASCYAPWFATVLRCARVAATVLGMLSEESRASKVSFADVVKRLSKQPEDAPTFVSKRPAAAERFLAVHAQIILSCFQHYPVQTVRKSAFVSQLKERMAMVRHSKLYASAGKTGKLRGVNRNPMKDRAAGARSKPMTATATTMVKSIWQAYFIAAPALATDQEPKDDGGAAAAADGVAAGVATCIGAGGNGTVAQDVGGLAREIEDDINEEENEEDVAEDALAGNPTSRSPLSKKNKKSKTDAAAKGKSSAAKNGQGSVKVTWIGAATVGRGGIKLYAAVKVNGVTINAGDAVELMPLVDSDSDQDENEIEDDEEGPAGTELGLVQAMWQDASGGKWVQLRCMVRGVETVLGDAASSSELFLTDELETRPLSAVIGGISAKRMDRPWDSSRREEYFKIDAELRARNEVAAQEGRPLELFWRRQYVPEEGMFRDVPGELQLGTRLEEPSEPETGVRALEDGTGFIKDGITYKIGDFLFVAPDVFDQMPEATRDVQLPEYLANSRFHKGSYAGLRAWGVGRLVKLGAAASKKATRDAKSKLSSITVTRYWRPEDISEDCAYTSESYHDVYASEETVTVDLEDVVRPVSVVPTGYGVPLDIDVFQCIGSFVRSSKSFGPVPADLAVPEHLKVKCKRSAQDGMDASATTAAKGKGKGKAAADDAPAAAAALTAAKGKGKASVAEAFSGGKFPGENGVALATMDIFAGCGGLSEGMHQAGAAYTRWAIEYESPAAEAFKVNNPLASVFCNNCNVLLHAAMAKAGMEGDCLASEEAVQQSKSLPAADHAALPLPGEVDFICGGPPCQGYSGMNRFNKGNWSMVQNSMVMAFLSYADFYRPRYFLLENVRNFVSHNKSFTFRLTLRSLLDMGYQVRFGVLNAGNFGVAQSRKRTFIWAAAPGEHLPDWPRLMHCFRTPQLCINLPGGVQYTAVRQTVGAPLRPITVRDAIGDLPSIHNGADVDEMDYSGGPQSAFQRTVRGDCSHLTDHISKQMNELNLERCRCIPINCPGADWRILEDIVRKDPSKEKFKGQPLVPWCLPNTADRHNGWRGLFGRLDWMGHFPTSTTDPQPMGKVGQVFHPEQHRIVSVRECARAQGFPDRHRFYGNVHSKHRQVGNAVPPPLAAALGRQLRKALEEKAAEDAAALLRAQM